MAIANLRAPLALLCSERLLANLAGCGGHRAELPTVRPVTEVFTPLHNEDDSKRLVCEPPWPSMSLSRRNVTVLCETQ
jgi:hypothetical protein